MATAADEMPTRVIDVGDPKQERPPRLVITRGLRERYLALSYCWGPAADTFTLRSDTMEDMLKAINEVNLAPTHREVVELARSLGVRFVWIDALCIIQGDNVDWEYESKRMAQVYGNAELTIIAGRSADVRAGFISNHHRGAVEPCAIPVGTSVPRASVFVSLPRSLKSGPIDTRGWCFQEKLLSRRALVFGEEQLIFQCQTRTVSEDGYVISAAGLPSFLQPDSFSSIDDKTRQREMTLKGWYEFLQQFTMRELSNPHDIFAAIASIAELAQRVLGSRYLAGVWEADMVRGLLWKPRHHIQLTFGPTKRPPPSKFAPGPVVRAPSWSWASISGPVLQNYNVRKASKYQCESFVKVRPTDPGSHRWSATRECDVRTLHMPSCRLQLMGCLAHAAISPRPVSDYLTAENPWKLYSRAKMCGHGLLLIPRDGGNGPELTHPDHVVAIGLFDIADERCDDIWCLLLIPNEGLLLRKGQNEDFHRMGWFILEEPRWFEGREEIEISLI